MIYSTQQDRFWDFMSIECRNNRTDAIAMEAMSKEFSGVARTPGDAASQRHVKLCERNIARSGQHIVGVMENAASKTMFLYTVGNAMDGGAEFLCRGVHVSKARSVARCMNMLRRRRREGHPVFAGQRAGSEDGSESYAIQEPADAADDAADRSGTAVFRGRSPLGSWATGQRCANARGNEVPMNGATMCQCTRIGGPDRRAQEWSPEC